MVVHIQVVIEKVMQATVPIVGIRFSEEEMFAANTITGELSGAILLRNFQYAKQTIIDFRNI